MEKNTRKNFIRSAVGVGAMAPTLFRKNLMNFRGVGTGCAECAAAHPLFNAFL